MTAPRPADPPRAARAWWRRVEAVHAVTYFAPESGDALAAAGLRGFWRGYFAARAAPLGPVEAAVATALFFNFRPSMVARALPAVWDLATPERVLVARRAGAATALRRVLPDPGRTAASVAGPLADAVGAAEGAGRALFAANRGLGAPDDPVEALWQHCTTLREHRGDGHVAALVEAGLDGCEALVLFATSQGLAREVFQPHRGWSDAEWDAAARRLEGRGHLAAGRLTPTGAEVRRSVERRTDDLAAGPYDALGPRARALLGEGLSAAAAAVVAAGTVPFPNPIGLPPPEVG